MSPRLTLVRTLAAARTMQLRLETLRIHAARQFPGNTVQQDRWVQAKLYVAGRKPSVKIGDQRPPDTSRALRRAHGVEIPLELPGILRRFLRPDPCSNR